MVQSTQTVKHLYWTTELSSQFNWRLFKFCSTASISSVGQFHIEKGEVSHRDEYFMCFLILSGLKFCGGRTSSVFTLLYIPERLHSVQSSKFGRIYVLNQLQIHKWDENHPLQGIPYYCVAFKSNIKQWTLYKMETNWNASWQCSITTISLVGETWKKQSFRAFYPSWKNV